MELMKKPDESKTTENGPSTKECYNKKHSFFDNLIVDDNSDSKARLDSNAELKKNKETFG